MGGLAISAAVFQVVPGHVLGLDGATHPAGNSISPGWRWAGQGGHDIIQFPEHNIVAPCDVDWAYAAGTFKKFPRARPWKDCRQMFEEQKDIDAVVVATPTMFTPSPRSPR